MLLLFYFGSKNLKVPFVLDKKFIYSFLDISVDIYLDERDSDELLIQYCISHFN
jgi:hypothetical protein